MPSTSYNRRRRLPGLAYLQFARVLLLIFGLSIVAPSFSQERQDQIDFTSDSIPPSIHDAASSTFELRKFTVPIALTAYGLFALENKGLLKLDRHIKYEVWDEEPHNHIGIDNYLQYGIGFSVFGLHALGIKGKNSFRDETMLFLLSNAIMGGVVNPMKHITRLQRPDGYGHNAFPSGHTATAFVGAEFLYQEYKDVSPIYGIAGYALASSVGYMRIYNNKHWMRDVVAGAGIGIASTKIAYLLYPSIKRWLWGSRQTNMAIAPTYENKAFGLSMVKNF